MIKVLHQVLEQKNILFYLTEGITVATVANLHEGFILTEEILYGILDNKTVLYLSGGSTPKELYKKLAAEEKLSVGAVGMVDERFGPKLHNISNEKMLQETGLLRYLQMRDIRFYPILQNKTCQETAKNYDEKLRILNATYQKSVAVLGLGADGHTAGIAPLRQGFLGQAGSEFKNPLFDDERKYLLASEFDDQKGPFKERVTMTFWGLSMLDVLIVLVFGSAKQNALEQMFESGSEKEIPARFFKRPEIAKKTLLITDQRV